MTDLVETFSNLVSLPIEHLVAFIPLAGIGVAAYALYVVHSIVKKRPRD